MSMDYKKMWYMMKENLLRESQRRELGTIRMEAAEQHLKIMDDIEVKAMKESQHVCECGGEKAHIRKMQGCRKTGRWQGYSEKDFRR